MERLKILILEDVPADADLVERELQKEKLVFISKLVETKEDFLRELEEFKPDIILSDYLLPQFTGMEALLLTLKHSPDAPFIIVTGSINEETAVDCIKAGAWDYVTKEHLARLGPAIKGVLERRRNLMEKEKAEEEMKCLNVKLAAKVKELEQVLYVTSHDLRTPLLNIHGYTGEIFRVLNKLKSLLDSVEIPSEINREIRAIIEEDFTDSEKYITLGVSRMDSLIAGLLSLSRLGRTELKQEQIDMNKLISDVFGDFNFKFRSSKVQKEISELPPCVGDYTQISMIFSNLMDNALKFLAPERPGVIRVSGYKDDGQSVYCVEDNGIGIAKEYHEKIFELFHQLNPSIRGEGLGLSIISKILERNRGEIRVESEKGKGSKFYVSLLK